jgi:hypothetical protein
MSLKFALYAPLTRRYRVAVITHDFKCPDLTGVKQNTNAWMNCGIVRVIGITTPITQTVRLMASHRLFRGLKWLVRVKTGKLTIGLKSGGVSNIFSKNLKILATLSSFMIRMATTRKA